MTAVGPDAVFLSLKDVALEQCLFQFRNPFLPPPKKKLAHCFAYQARPSFQAGNVGYQNMEKKKREHKAMLQTNGICAVFFGCGWGAKGKGGGKGAPGCAFSFFREEDS